MKRNWTVLAVFLVLIALLGGCKMVWRAVRYNVPSVTDYKLWQERPVTRAGTIHNFADGRAMGIAPVTEWGLGKWYKPGMTTEDYMKKTGTVAFVVLRGDTLLYEYYGDDFADTSRFNVFSMTKAYMSTLTGIAVSEGKIKSIDQSISEYLPWCIDSAICKITIRDLLQMTSGLKSSEGYLNPWGTSTKMYYGDQIPKIMRDLEVRHPAGTRYFYQNVNSQLLGMIVRRAVGKPLGTYLSEKIWEPMGMEADAGWSIAEGTDDEKAFCCLNARARDFARFGLLVLNEGNWKGKQLIPRDWLKTIARIDTSRGANNRYHFNWFLTPEQDDFWAEGLLGQFTYVCPQTRTVIVRIGNTLDFKVPWYDSFKILAGLKEKPKPMEFAKRDLKPYAGEFVFGLSNFGDTTLAGKEAVFVPKRKGLKVKTNFQKTWYALPQNDSTFYHIGFGRMLTFHKDEQGKYTAMHWNRRGNIWVLGKRE
ncbi:MAG: serine hydrolase [Bacteroidetes bacterium]|nr:serine hydrolase [Bacteroidota bacterium]